MREKIFNDVIKAMKEKDKDTLPSLRSVKGAIQLEEINKKQELNDDEVTSIITKQIKLRKESIVEFEKGNRQDLIDQVTAEINILNKYMPRQMSSEEVTKVIDQVFSDIKPTGPSDIGKIMGAISPLVRGKADMGLVNKMIKERLNNL